MSNPNLPPVGFQYVIDASGVNNNVNIIVQAQNRIAQSQGQVTRGAESFDKAIGANTRSVRLLTSELVNVAGGGSQAASVITGLLTAVGPLSIALVGISAGLALVKSNLDSSRASFEAQQQAVANTTRSYDDLLKSRLAAIGSFGAATTAIGLASQFESIFSTEFELIGTKSADAFSKALLLGLNNNITPQSIAQFLSELAQSTGDFQTQLAILSRARFDAAQKEAATQQFVQGAVNRQNAINIQAEIDKLRASGATLDQLIPKYYELAKAKAATEAPTRGAGDVGAGKVGRGAFGPVTGSDINDLIKRQSGDLSFLNPYADKFAQQFLDAQQQYQEASAAAAQQHISRLADIERQGAEARAHIARSYARALRDIDENLRDARAQAAEGLAESLAKAEENAQERRAHIDQQYADRRADIETNYQDTIKRINADYSTSIFDAAVNLDARGLVRAKQQRAQQLKDADTTRQKDLQNAQKEHDKAAKELADALAKQKAELQKDYERRIRDLEANAAKQRDKAKENYTDALSDQQKAEKDAKDSEARSYAERKAQIAQSFVDRKKQLIKGLTEEKDLSEKYAKDIIASLKGILDPKEIAALIKEFDAQLKAKIDITVTPFATEGKGTKPKPPPPPEPVTGECPPGYHQDAYGHCVRDGNFALGGFDATGGIRRLHAGEWIIPNPITAGMGRWQTVVDGFASHASRTVPMAGRGLSGAGGERRIALEVTLNGDILDARIVRGSTDTTVRILKGSKR